MSIVGQKLEALKADGCRWCGNGLEGKLRFDVEGPEHEVCGNRYR